MKLFLAALFAGLAMGQDSTPSLTDLLGSSDSLSSLTGLLEAFPDVTELLGGLDNITILAPSNDALSTFLGDMDIGSPTDLDAGTVTNLLRYHVLNGTVYADAITETPAFPKTLLTNMTYANVTGGQVVEAVMSGDNVTFYSGLRMMSNVTEANLNFTGGVVHIIDRVLTIPMNLSSTAIEGGLAAVAGALTQADLVEPLQDMMNITVFAPSNSAFAAIASATGNLTMEQLTSILEYHVIAGTVAYSSDLENMTVATAEGSDVQITVSDGNVYVDNARVIIPDILIANGVVHVIDSVLNPDSEDVSPNPSTTSPAFPGATTASNGENPFTSGVPTMSGTNTGLQPPPEETGSGGSDGGDGGDGGDSAAPRAEAGVAMAALLGGLALAVNGLV